MLRRLGVKRIVLLEDGVQALAYIQQCCAEDSGTDTAVHVADVDLPFFSLDADVAKPAPSTAGVPPTARSPAGSVCGNGSEEWYHRPTIVLMDITMPGMSGVDVMRGAPPSFLRSCVCVAMTGSVDSDAMVVYGQCGFFKVLAKPFNLGQLQELLDVALQHSLAV